MIKRLSVLFLTLLLLLFTGCITNSTAGADKAAGNFITGLRDKQIEVLMSAYHDDAQSTFLHPSRTHETMEGRNVIREAQLQGFENRPEMIIDGVWEREMKGDKIQYRILIELPDIKLLNTLIMTKQNDQWAISEQFIEIYNP